MNWLHENGFETFDWPARSPDLNIIENVWTMLSNIVYSSKFQYNTKDELWEAIERAVATINADRRDDLNSLFDSIPRRLKDVLEEQGAITKH